VAVVRKILSSSSQFWLGMPIATIPITAATTVEAMKTRRNSLVKR
jgi:HAMP domain-containing protein